MTKYSKISFVLSSLTLVAALNPGCSSKTVSESSTKTQNKDFSYQGYGAETVSPETLKRFAPKAVSPELSRKIQGLLDIRSPGLGMIHPDGKRLFFNWKVTGTSQVWMLSSAMSFPVQMTGGEDLVQLVGMTPNGKFLILSKDRNGEENPGIYLQSSDGGPLRLVQHTKKVQSIFEFVSDDSNWIYFKSNDQEPDSYTIYRWRIQTGQRELVFKQKGYWSVVDFKGTDRLLLSQHTSNTASEIFEWKISERELTSLFGHGENVEYEAVYGAQENEFFYSVPRGEFRELFHFQSGKEKSLTPGLKGDVISVAIDQSRKHLVYTTRVDAYSRIHVLDAKKMTEIAIPWPSDAEQTSLGFLSRDGKTMMAGVESSFSPRVSFSYDFQTKKTTRWVVPSVPEVDAKKFIRAESGFYKSRDGVSIPVFVRKPNPQCGVTLLCPVVVHFHGGPEGQSTPGFSVFAQMFLDEGFIFVEPNVRGSDGYGQSWLHRDNGAKRLEVITDIEDAALELKKQFSVGGKPPPIGAMGWSYGGYSTLYAMTRFAGAYDAGVALVGMSNLLTFLQNTAPYRRAMRIPEYGDPEKDRNALVQLSPTTFLNQIKSPLLIIQGAEDPRVPVGEAVSFYEAMEKKKIPGGLIVFQDEGHGAQKRGNKVLELGSTIEFFKANLKIVPVTP